MTNVSAVELRFLSQAMAYPDKNFLKALSEIKNKYSVDFSFMNKLLEIAEKENLNELQAEYTHLFISGFPKTPCPPYESFFLEGRLFGNANMIVRNIYSKWAMEVEPALADHLATEFEFLAFLKALEETSDSFNDSNKTMVNFFKEHILNWVPKFAGTLKDNTQNKFYSYYADYLLKLLSE